MRARKTAVRPSWGIADCRCSSALGSEYRELSRLEIAPLNSSREQSGTVGVRLATKQPAAAALRRLVRSAMYCESPPRTLPHNGAGIAALNSWRGEFDMRVAATLAIVRVYEWLTRGALPSRSLAS